MRNKTAALLKARRKQMRKKNRMAGRPCNAKEITAGEYVLVEQACDNRCLICGISSERLAIDHCHNTGSLRGLLCVKCNLGIGCFDDDPLLILKAVNYLTAFATVDNLRWSQRVKQVASCLGVTGRFKDPTTESVLARQPGEDWDE